MGFVKPLHLSIICCDIVGVAVGLAVGLINIVGVDLVIVGVISIAIVGTEVGVEVGITCVPKGTTETTKETTPIKKCCNA